MRLGIILIGDPLRIVAAGAVSNVVTISMGLYHRSLVLAKAMIRQHGGDLSIVGELGVGTTVSVTFPAERVL